MRTDRSLVRSRTRRSRTSHPVPDRAMFHRQMFHRQKGHGGRDERLAPGRLSRSALVDERRDGVLRLHGLHLCAVGSDREARRGRPRGLVRHHVLRRVGQDHGDPTLVRVRCGGVRLPPSPPVDGLLGAALHRAGRVRHGAVADPPIRQLDRPVRRVDRRGAVRIAHLGVLGVAGVLRPAVAPAPRTLRRLGAGDRRLGGDRRGVRAGARPRGHQRRAVRATPGTTGGPRRRARAGARGADAIGRRRSGQRRGAGPAGGGGRRSDARIADQQCGLRLRGPLRQAGDRPPARDGRAELSGPHRADQPDPAGYAGAKARRGDLHRFGLGPTAAAPARRLRRHQGIRDAARRGALRRDAERRRRRAGPRARLDVDRVPGDGR